MNLKMKMKIKIIIPIYLSRLVHLISISIQREFSPYRVCNKIRLVELLLELKTLLGLQLHLRQHLYLHQHLCQQLQYLQHRHQLLQISLDSQLTHSNLVLKQGEVVLQQLHTQVLHLQHNLIHSKLLAFLLVSMAKSFRMDNLSLEYQQIINQVQVA